MIENVNIPTRIEFDYNDHLLYDPDIFYNEAYGNDFDVLALY